LTANIHVPDAVSICKKVLRYLEGQEVVLEDCIASFLGGKGCRIEDMDVDVLVTVGGDGTILRSLQMNSAPILGINAGVLGFLTEISKDNLGEGLKRVIEGDYIIDERLRLKVSVDGVKHSDALNEAVLHTAHVAKIRQFEIYVDNQLVVDTRADGIIVATPTGSTCYAMSVGAPIVDPKVEALVIAPMAPFKLSARPFVVPATSNITVRLVRKKPCVLVVDGQDEMPLDGGEEIEFTKSERPARFISLGGSFYSRTREKLMGSSC